MRPRLNVLFVGPIAPFPGGAGVLNTQLLLGLARRGHTILAVAGVTPATTEAAASFDRRHPEVGVRRHPVSKYAVGGVFATTGEAWRENHDLDDVVVAELAAQRPDVILFGREPVLPSVMAAAAARGIPHIIIVHGSTAHKLAKGALPDPVATPKLAALRRSHRVIAVARHMREVLILLGVPRIQVIENSIDAGQFSPAPKDQQWRERLGIAEGAVVVAHLSNLKPVKRPLDLVHAAARALPRDPRLVFVVAGDGELRGAMETLAADLGVKDRFRFAGWVPHDSVPAILNLADMVVMPSESEARSLVFLEAQACGRVLVASDIPASLEMIRDGVTGLLFPMGSVDALVDRIVAAAADREWRTAIGRAAREQALGASLEAFWDAYEDALYDAADQAAEGAA